MRLHHAVNDQRVTGPYEAGEEDCADAAVRHSAINAAVPTSKHLSRDIDAWAFSTP
jgi:hypothetical protein